MMSEKSYRLGNYRITIYDAVLVQWERHVSLAMARSGKCFFCGDVLIIGKKYHDEDGFQCGEFLEHLRKLPPWTLTRFYCFEGDLIDSATGQAPADKLLERLSSFARMNRTDPSHAELALPGAYRAGHYQITTAADGRITWKAHEELDRVVSGPCTIESDILIIGPREHDEKGESKKEFLGAVNRLPQWSGTMLWCRGSVLRQCREMQQEETSGMFGRFRKYWDDRPADEKAHQQLKESRESKLEPRPNVANAGRCIETARKILMKGRAAMSSAWRHPRAGKAQWKWLALFIAALAAVGLTAGLVIIEKGFYWGHGARKHHQEHHDHDRRGNDDH